MSLAFTVSLSVFEFSEADTSFEVFYNSSKYFIYGYGGASFCFATSILLSIAYATTLLCSMVPKIRNRLSITDKPPFYQFCGLLMATHCLMAIGNLFEFSLLSQKQVNITSYRCWNDLHQWKPQWTLSAKLGFIPLRCLLCPLDIYRIPKSSLP